jgi:tetratricopeptide (TPR) repeat protein
LVILLAAAALADCEALAAGGSPDAVDCFRSVAVSAADHGVRAEALWQAGDVQGANAAFRDAVAARPEDATLRARWGRLFLTVHQQADAEALFREALERDPDNVEALLGTAELSLGRFEPGVRKSLARVLRREPQHPEAHLLLGRMQLEQGDTATVRRELTGLLEADALPGRYRLEAFALLAAADALDDALPSPWTERALAENPRFAPIHAVPGHFYVINRRYAEAVAAYERAVAADPRAWDAHAELGINLLRLNRFEQARRHLEEAYRGDPYNALTVNTLRLLDLLDEQFATRTVPGLIMRAPADQAAALAPYVESLTARAAAEMSRRYGYRPEPAVVIELYEHHDDFAVRTAGLPGLGILGATFGDVVVMDGPAAKGIDDGFDWASALWHELAHVYTLGATGNRVSRWFSEGVSVLEEWRHGPSPQAGVPLHFLEAVAEDRLLPVAELDQGFLRPRYPQQIAISYVQAGLVCEVIEDEFDGGLARMLTAYGEGVDTPAAVRSALGIEPQALDRLLDAHLQRRFGTVLAGLDTYRDAQRRAQEAVAREAWSEAAEAAAAAVALYPEYVQGDSAYLALIRAADARDDAALLDDTLQAYFDRGGRAPWALARLAERHGNAGDMAAELAVRRALVRTVPLDGARQAELGERLAAAGRLEAALTHQHVALTLGPHDRAEAQLRLARTYHRLGRTEQARRALLLALEIAPRYGPALDLLLTINGMSADDRLPSDR